MTHYNLTETAAMCGVETRVLSYWFLTGLVPPPDVLIGKRKFYSAEVAQQCVAKAEADKLLVNHRGLAEAINIPPSSLGSYIAAGVIPQPTHKSGRRMFWHKDEVAEIATFVAAHHSRDMVKTTTRDDVRRAAGHFSMNDVAKMCGVSKTSILYHIRKKRLARPSHNITGFGVQFYNQAEADQIKRFFATIKGSHQRGPRATVPLYL